MMVARHARVRLVARIDWRGRSGVLRGLDLMLEADDRVGRGIGVPLRTGRVVEGEIVRASARRSSDDRGAEIQGDQLGLDLVEAAWIRSRTRAGASVARGVDRRAWSTMRHMAAFSSARERRLWLAVAAAIGVIVAGLVFGNALAGLALRVEAALFATGTLLVGAAAVAHGARARPGGLEVAAGLGLVAVALLSAVRFLSPVERSHLIEYGVVAVLLHAALAERVRNGHRVKAPALVAIGVTVAIGVLDEGVQALIPWRVFDPVDLVFNVTAAVLAVGTSVAVERARLWWGRRHGGDQRHSRI